MVTLNLNAENEQVGGNRSAHDAQSEEGSQPSRSGNQNEERGDQFGNSGPDTAPRFHEWQVRKLPDLGENEDRLGSGSEFKKEGLEHDESCSEAADP